ncbi:shikimate kinase [Nanoarchaeota archaeon]
MRGSVTLTGPRCSGKSKVGKELARILGFSHIDLDRVFEEQHGSITDYVKKHGLPGFRRHENIGYKVLCHEHQFIRTIISSGGGLFAHNDGEQYRLSSVELGKNFGKIIYLTPSDDLRESAEILSKRISKDPTTAGSRPALTKDKSASEEVLDVLTMRDPIYRAVAYEVIRTEQIGGIKKVAEYMAEKIRSKLLC